MKSITHFRNIIFITLLVCPLSFFLLSYKTGLTCKEVLVLNRNQNDSDLITLVGLSLANGYTGQSSIFISKDSIHYKSDFYKLKYDTITPKELWQKISDISNINDISKIISGKSEQDRDGTDTICCITTKFKKYYSFTNGYGKEFDKQKEFLSLLTTELSTYFIKALKESK
jgi:hypothetical protein